ncbi:MAG: methylated-DNA--[protein]-cysteine S-methyltransferase [Anaerolineales bacterium]
MGTTIAQTLYYSSVNESPLGALHLLATDLGICFFAFGVEEDTFLSEADSIGLHGKIIVHPSPHPVLAQVKAYLRGELMEFSTAIDWNRMTSFQTAVYRVVLAIPYGETRTYGQIAAQIGKPRAARAVGAANSANPLPLIIPCHRLVGTDGSLRGYSGVGGLKTKRWLLNLEKGH